MYEFNDDSRVALAYRSEVKHQFDGSGKFRLPGLISRTPDTDATLRGAFANDGASVDVRLPASFSMSGYHRFSASKLP
jgi:long-subunit fatty acid transport protein